MDAVILKNRIDYDGSQLRSHWIFDRTGETGDSCAAFIGGCDVAPDHMVDLADKRDNCKIFSHEMLHFIIEHFDSNLEAAILRQRLFVSIVRDVILRQAQDEREFKIERRGNDLYDGNAKINISIATASPVSTLIHVGVNIRSDGTPVKTKGLKDYNIEPKMFAEEVLKKYKEELEGVKKARAKVKWVA
ncbi:MAG: hypothetical protein COV46_08385 [Deltaproteobacteria bacterium CG11_big_fil_rev_8_21_14_0_20_49_13]|nr:MAG: hypothetical protein COV46_08385 [Deltaproteobacteria bacterium CG11_big_fil_rev_8_21_14_0_20_49_13]